MIMGYLRGALSQLRSLWKLLLLLYIPIVLLFIFVGLLSRVVHDTSLAFFLRDIVATGKLPFFAGFVPQLASILWSAALTVCFFTLFVLARGKGGNRDEKRLLLYGGALTLMLLLDDVFLFHEEIAPKYLHINEKIVIVTYGILGLGFLILNWREILRSEYLILGLALGLFGISIVLDSLPIDDFNLRYFWKQLEMFIEDGTKFAGIATWLTYFARYSYQRITSVEQDKSVP